MLITKYGLEKLEKMTEEIVSEMPFYKINEYGGIEISTYYDDELSLCNLRKISSADSPLMAYEEVLNERAWEYEEYNNPLQEFRKEIEERMLRKGIDKETITELQKNEEYSEWLGEIYYFYYSEDDFNPYVNVNIMLDTGNGNYDFTCDSFLNGYNYSYSKESSVGWLAKQYKKGNKFLKEVRAFNTGVDAEDTFVESLVNELINLPSHMATLTFLVKMKLHDFIAIREESIKEKDLNDSYYLTERKGKGYIVLGKETMCGLFNPWQGGGSVLEIQLPDKLKLPIKCIWDLEIETGKSLYGYSVNNVYGLMDSAWQESLIDKNF